MRLTKKLTVVIAAAGLGAGAVVGIAQAGDDTPAPAWQPTTTDAAVPATAAAKAAFPVLAAQRRSAADDTTQVARLAAQARIGIDSGGARVVGSTDAGPIWLIPANGGLCLGLEDTADQTLGIACEDDDAVAARGTAIGDGTTIYGIVPDDTTSVTVTPAGGAPRDVDVDANGVYRLPQQEATVTLDGDHGRSEFGVAG